LAINTVQISLRHFAHFIYYIQYMIILQSEISGVLHFKFQEELNTALKSLQETLKHNENTKG